VQAHSEYTTRLKKWRALQKTEDELFRQVGNIRLGVLTVAAVMLWGIAFHHWFNAAWLAAPVAAFIALAIWHETIVGRLRRAARAIRFYERGLARIEDRWAGSGNQGARFQDPEHLYAGDIDIFGKGSLFELLSTARTTVGEATLADWLTGMRAPADAIRQRQQAVTELSERLELREDLAVIGDDVQGAVHEDRLTAWATALPVPFPAVTTLLLFGVPVFAIATVVLWIMDITGLRLFLFSGLAALGAARWLMHASAQVFHDVEQPARELKILSLLLERIERDRWSAPRLIQLAAELETGGQPASRAIARLHALLERRSWSHNLVFQIPARFLLWDEHHAVRIEAWRRKWGAAVGRWTSAVGEMEALCSLAAFQLEHPDAAFPEFTEGGTYEAEALRHPLISLKKSVENDVHIGGTGPRLWIISGSNMSGKSTLLRAVALNAVLAWAGAPVLARRLRISPLAIGASVRVFDSLQDGRSLFYAEITRLRKILDLTLGSSSSPVPVLFLIDELLHGTNSHDRRIGAEAVLRGLIDRGAIGMVTTHDLALAGIADSLAPRAANVHFEDHIEDGVVQFDYRLRPGIVERSNALELMRAVGLIP